MLSFLHDAAFDAGCIFSPAALMPCHYADFPYRRADSASRCFLQDAMIALPLPPRFDFHVACCMMLMIFFFADAY